MTRTELESRIRAFIEARADGSRDEGTRDALLNDIAAYQSAHVEPYRRLCLAMRGPLRAPGPRLAPAMPADVFRYARVASHAAELDVRVFRTSGTTRESRGEHPFRSLALYDLAAEAAARHMLFPDREKMRLVLLAPAPSEAPDSSLSYMLGRFASWFGEETTWAIREGRLVIDELAVALDRTSRDGAPIALLGTSFAFVHALDALSARSFELPAGSRIMQTGGFKGRSRAIDPEEMRRLLGERFGVREAMIIAEYGMTEMSSQMYETTLRDALAGEVEGPRRLWVPGWVRATPVDPETLSPVEGDAVGILRVDDAANLDSVAAIQTADLARRVGDGVVVIGRAEGASPRGCSIAADAALGGAAC